MKGHHKKITLNEKLKVIEKNQEMRITNVWLYASGLSNSIFLGCRLAYLSIILSISNSKSKCLYISISAFNQSSPIVL